MEDFVRYMVMYDNPYRDGEETVKEVFEDEEEAFVYIEDNPFTEFTFFEKNAENYVVRVVTTYEKVIRKD